MPPVGANCLCPRVGLRGAARNIFSLSCTRRGPVYVCQASGRCSGEGLSPSNVARGINWHLLAIWGGAMVPMRAFPEGARHTQPHFSCVFGGNFCDAYPVRGRWRPAPGGFCDPSPGPWAMASRARAPRPRQVGSPVGPRGSAVSHDVVPRHLCDAQLGAPTPCAANLWCGMPPRGTTPAALPRRLVRGCQSLHLPAETL